MPTTANQARTYESRHCEDNTNRHRDIPLQNVRHPPPGNSQALRYLRLSFPVPARTAREANRTTRQRVTRDLEPWWLSARCAETDPDIWVLDTGDSPAPAKRICAGCPGADQCLTDALIADDNYGVRGGLTAYERRNIRKGAA
jgi:WhiB family redox-sensing transcriptional regulator